MSASPAPSERLAALKLCPPRDWYVVTASDVVLTPEEWLELEGYDVKIDNDAPPGAVFLMVRPSMVPPGPPDDTKWTP